jgi:hypothetical protein
MRSLKTVLIAAVTFTACGDDPAGPASGRFNATMRGARDERFEGTSYAARVFSEAWPTGRFSLVMSASAASPGRPIVISCPEQQLESAGARPLAASLEGCRGTYHLLGATPDDPPVEEVISTQGTVRVTTFTASAVVGSFDFTGPLLVRGVAAGSVTISGAFNATRFSQ